MIVQLGNLVLEFNIIYRVNYIIYCEVRVDIELELRVLRFFDFIYEYKIQ